MTWSSGISYLLLQRPPQRSPENARDFRRPLQLKVEDDPVHRGSGFGSAGPTRFGRENNTDTVFDPIALTCGHIFCYICACGAASVSIIDGLRSAGAKAKCPLCRQAGVFESYVRLTELNILLKNNCHEYWEQRLHSERQDRVRQAKEHWESQCRAFMGM